MDAEKLKVPPTEQEIARVLDADASLEQAQDIIRRLVFQRDEEEERRENEVIEANWDER